MKLAPDDKRITAISVFHFLLDTYRGYRDEPSPDEEYRKYLESARTATLCTMYEYAELLDYTLTWDSETDSFTLDGEPLE